MVELYQELRPIIDSCSEDRRKAKEREEMGEAGDLRDNRFGIAVVGLPNVVCLS